MPTHRDVNNHTQYPNASIGFGQFKGGELWIEGQGSQCGRKGEVEVRQDPGGRALEGMRYNIQERFVMFSPKQWHGTCDWEGDRWVLTVFVSRGWDHLEAEEREELRKLGFPLPRNARKEQAYPAEQVNREPKDRHVDEKIRKQLYLLHCATGHSSTRHLVQALKRRGAEPRVLELAEAFRCPVCAEKKRPPPRNLAALEPLPPKLYTIEADIGHWVHPLTGESSNFMMIIDEGSRFRTGRVLTTGLKKSPNAQECLQYLQEGWTQYFGYPRCLRLDPSGAFRSFAVEEWCDTHSAIKGVKEVMTKLCEEDEELAAPEALAQAVTTFNHREIIRGFSPAQHILGQAPDETGRFIPATKECHPDLLVENASGEFERAVRRRATAEKAFSDWHAAQRLMRAKHSRHRPCYDFEPGELVFYWRTQDASKGRRQPGSKHGRFLGPARILATETRRDAGGNPMPGGAVWLVKGRSLLKCAPEQLRRATEREELLESLADPSEQQLPWTYHTVAQEVGGNRFEDITGEQPSQEEWHRAQDPEAEVQPSRYRIRTKRPAGNPPDEEEGETFPEDGHSEERARSRSRGRTKATENTGDKPAAWWNTISEQQWPDGTPSYWQDPAAAVEVELSFPDTQRGRERVWRDLEGYFVGQLKRRAVEVSERRLSPEDRAAFQDAKTVEVRNFIASKAFEILPETMKPSKDQAIGMRWILTWKQKEDGTRKPKARAVLLGYQDESYEHRATTSPVMTRQTRQLLLQPSAWKRWRIQKGDVTGAFLQSRQYPDDLYCIPCPEICSALGINPGSITKVRKACYGLVDAPLEWYRSVDTYFRELGFERLWSDSCCWALREEGTLRGIISGHVDDFLFAGKQGDRLWESKLQAIQGRFKWGDWEADRFTQCGVVIEQKAQGFELSQPNYLDGVHEININATRKKNRDSPTTEREKTQLRALLGGISWHAQQVAPYLAAEVGLLLTEVTRSTVETIIKSNILLTTAKHKASYRMKVHAFKEDTDLALVAWVDAANANRSDGGSTQGIFLGMTDVNIMKGELSPVSPVAWHSQKIDRMCRSPGAAESQAAVNGEDSLYSARFQWNELLWGNPDLQDPDNTVRGIPGCVVTDSRNVYDKLNTEVLVVKGAEKRTSIELLALKESQQNTQVQLRWVHSEAQLANNLTKAGGYREYELYYKMDHHWRLVEDQAMMSAKRRKECGLQPLEQPKPEVSIGDDA